jgi:hypothetical protein
MSHAGFDRSRVIVACDHALLWINQERDKEKTRILEKYRYGREFPFFWRKFQRSDAEIMERMSQKDLKRFMNFLFEEKIYLSRLARLASLSEDNLVYMSLSDFSRIQLWY